VYKISISCKVIEACSIDIVSYLFNAQLQLFFLSFRGSQSGALNTYTDPEFDKLLSSS